MGWVTTSWAWVSAVGTCRGYTKAASAQLGGCGWKGAQPGLLPAPEGLGVSLGQLPLGPEHARRLDIFAHNLAQAQRLQEEDLGTAEFGVTPFSDLTGTINPSGL